MDRERKLGYQKDFKRRRIARGLCREAACLNAPVKGKVLCQKHLDYNAGRKFGISGERYRRLIDAAKGICSCCGNPAKELGLDHNHETGEIRRPVCRSCNSKLHTAPFLMEYLNRCSQMNVWEWEVAGHSPR